MSMVKDSYHYICMSLFIFPLGCLFVFLAGLVRQPKWGHLRDLHKAIKLCEDALLATDPTVTSLGSNLVVITI